MVFRTRYLIKPEDLNAGNTLYGGKLLFWIDEQAAIYAMCQLGSKNLVTKLVSTIDFVSPARQKDIIEIGVQATKFGRTSISLHVVVRNKETEAVICEIENMVFVLVDENGKPIPHGKTMPIVDSLEEEVTETIKVDDYTYEISSKFTNTASKNGSIFICLDVIKKNSLPENQGMQRPFITTHYTEVMCSSCRKLISTDNPNVNVKVFKK